MEPETSDREFSSKPPSFTPGELTDRAPTASGETVDLARRLLEIRGVTFTAASHRADPKQGWNGLGIGTVETESPAPGTVLFHERGTWRTERGDELPFHNTFRWTVIDPGRLLRLEHLRFGADRPVHLFDLAPNETGCWVPRKPHLCAADRYDALLRLSEEGFTLEWRIEGPEKNETLHYRYRRTGANAGLG